MIKYILMDIEGTTTPISFVHEVLFPYAAQHLPEYVKAHAQHPDVSKSLLETQETVKKEAARTIDQEEAIQQLLTWTAQDRKHPALKRLQGMIWADGYAARAFTSRLYADVSPSLQHWHALGCKLGIYSSGSVAAQKLLFAHTDYGDLTPILSDYFDTDQGPKRETDSYARIVKAIARPAAMIVFLSDIEEELDAAKQQGIKTIQLLRPGTKAGNRHPTAATFIEVSRICGL